MDVSFSRGNTLRRIMVAMNREQMGSAMFQPKFSIRSDDIMTPTLPRVSARTCRNTPTMQSNEVREKSSKLKIFISCIVLFR